MWPARIREHSFTCKFPPPDVSVGFLWWITWDVETDFLDRSCVQINVTGGGSATPAGVSFPGAYVGTDPGITINIYYPVLTSYTPPGPAVYSG